MILLDKISWRRWFVVAVALLFLPSCAHRFTAQGEMPLSSAAQRLKGNPPDLFYIQGKISVKHGNKAYVAAFDLHKEAAQSTLNIFSPLKQQIAQIIATENHAVLIANQTEHHAHSTEELTETLFHWRLPLSALYYWLYGFVLPDRDFSVLSATKERIQFSQEHWMITLENYQQNAYGFYPKRLLLNREDLALRLSILEQKQE